MAIPLSARPDLSRDESDPAWTVGVEVDLVTALALARASTKALLELSPLAHREISAALAHEIDTLETRRDPHSVAAAQALRQYLEAA
ncbi:MAG: hypothetical protein WA047_17625 [Phenylobacterium sp.]|jgi:hypothetical protein|uniref:hypothetical protein n=1 Tax=Phenylobacterium sp. TaxID=1871053 RepID=UPI003BB7B917